MRIPLLAFCLALPFATASAAPSPKAVPKAVETPPLSTSRSDCGRPPITYAQKGRIETRAQNLGELPPANAYLAVDRHVGGCPEPAIVRTGIGR